MADPSIYGEVAQAIPVVIGGLLAVGGGVIAQVITHWLSISRDERNLRRERLEQLVKALFAHQEWLDERRSVMIFRNEDHDKPNPMNEVQMIQALHFPELRTEILLLSDTEMPLLSFILNQRAAHIKNPANFIQQYDHKPFLEDYKRYLSARNTTVQRCRQLLPAPQPTLLNGLWKFLATTVNKMDGK
jgi:hypothetical protein